jgi:hypothetical protein
MAFCERPACGLALEGWLLEAVTKLSVFERLEKTSHLNSIRASGYQFVIIKVFGKSSFVTASFGDPFN